MRRYAFIGMLALQASAYNKSIAGEVTFDVGLEAEYVSQNIESIETSEEFDINNQVVTPYASLFYKAKKLEFRFTGEHNKVRRALDSENVTTDYTSFDYSSRANLIDNFLTLNIRGNQGFRAAQQRSILSDDYLLNAANLTKLQSQSASLNFNIPRNSIIGIQAVANISKQKAEDTENEILNNGLDSQFYGGQLNVVSGRGLKGSRVSLDGNINYTEREQRGDFVTLGVNLTSDTELTKSLGFVVSAYYDNNEIKNAENENSEFLREFYSVGAGLRWQSRTSRSIQLLWNRSFTESVLSQDDEEDNFLSLELDWQFSPRTRMSAGLTRRLLGDTGNFSFSHTLRNWRSSLSYSERVTTNAQLVASQSVGLFVCENGATNISDCSLSDSLEPNLENGQFIQPIVTQNVELNDRIVVSERVTAQTAITRRRTTVSIIASFLSTEEIELERELETLLLSANISFNLSRRSQLFLSHSYSDSSSLLDMQENGSQVRESSIRYVRTMSERLKLSLGYRHLDRNGDNFTGGSEFGVTGPLKDNRISVALSYDYGNRR